MNKTFFYKDKPIFGLDIGFDDLKVMQIVAHDKKRVVRGYGTASFSSDSFKDGVIVKPEAIAESAHKLFSKDLVGDITTRRCIMSIPTSHTFTRTMQLPNLSKKDTKEAVKLEAEQYIPLATDELYLDYSIISRDSKTTELLVVAVPKNIVDSYIVLAKLLKLEVVGLETTIGASCRLFVHTEQSDVPTVLMDFGTVSSDITIYDESLIVMGTVPGGGDSFTEAIAKQLGMNHNDAHVIKTRYGLGVSKKQKDISVAVMPLLDQLIKEVRRMIRYYEDRGGNKRKISQIVTLGGGANMPGLSEFMTSTLRLPVRMCYPWHKLSFGGLQPPSGLEKSLYGTVTGLALVDPNEILS